MSAVMTISKQTARRFIMGRQGLWPGRRWIGQAGAAAAIQACEAVQMDPLMVVARSHDIALWSRVLNYVPGDLDHLIYHNRDFFDYGGSLFVYPMSELPHWRIQMHEHRRDGRWARVLSEDSTTVDHVRRELQNRGPLGNRDLDGNKRVESYRGRKDTALALYALWITGEVMVHHRRRFEKIYDLSANIVPLALDYVADETQAMTHFGRKVIAFSGMAREKRWSASLADCLHKTIPTEVARQMLVDRIESGEFARVKIESSKEFLLVLAEDLHRLEILETDKIPGDWDPAGPSTLDEVTFLAPLDIVSARGRAKQLFDFDYVWEVYKPAALRRWGYYTLPILFSDHLVGRLDPRLDRTSATLRIEGFWLEDSFSPDIRFADALSAGLLRFATFLDAVNIFLNPIQPFELRKAIRSTIHPYLNIVEE